MSISIGTATQSSARDTHVAWLRRREDSRISPAGTLTTPRPAEAGTEPRP